MSSDTSTKLEKSIQQVLGERFVHNLSGLIYNSVSTLWHIDPECEEHLSHISARVISALFFLELLSHIDALIKKKLRVGNLTDAALTDPKVLKQLKERLGREKDLKALTKKLLPRMRRLVDTIGAENLEKVTQIAHTGDYLLGSLEEMRSSGDPDYSMWLQSLPYYYERDINYVTGTDRGDFNAVSEDSAGQDHMHVEHLGFKEKTSGHRINLATHQTTEEGFFPCTPKRRPGVRTCTG